MCVNCRDAGLKITLTKCNANLFAFFRATLECLNNSWKLKSAMFFTWDNSGPSMAIG